MCVYICMYRDIDHRYVCMYVRMYVCVCTRVYIRTYIYKDLYLPTDLSICLSIDVSMYRSIDPSILRSIDLSICMSCVCVAMIGLIGTLTNPIEFYGMLKSIGTVTIPSILFIIADYSVAYCLQAFQMRRCWGLPLV